MRFLGKVVEQDKSGVIFRSVLRYVLRKGSGRVKSPEK